MFASEVIKVPIERPYADVYEFLADPLNFNRWAATPGSEMQALDGGDWLVDIPAGQQMVIRFAPRNNFGVLDYQIFRPGETSGPITPVRLIANGDGCELLLLWKQRPDVPPGRFRSDVEWIESDLHRLKTLLEGG